MSFFLKKIMHLLWILQIEIIYILRSMPHVAKSIYATAGRTLNALNLTEIDQT